MLKHAIAHICTSYIPSYFLHLLLTGPPEKVQTTQLETCVFDNYENFPEFEVRVLDKWGQPSVIKDKNIRLALSCEAFSQMILLSTITNGKAKFPVTPIRIINLAELAIRNVIVSLVIPDNQKKNNIIKKTLKELFSMQIQIKPSNVCQQIKIIQIGNDQSSEQDFLSLESVAGSVVTNLKVIAFSQNGEQLTDEQFLSQEPHFTCTWAEVSLIFATVVMHGRWEVTYVFISCTIRNSI